ncbi:hypothetical protein BJI67_09425 [Acidihalobacter aeolianus]|uniref:Host attachment protein n=1 Tax=Acidihalobacter aeolianus TaxID=2792603 RepID=A0A1D8K8I5_9GAMM|nr:host attachment protein [Acidihalobacter aeolianus]AOV17255.1 hypothetical protein BJI67_09425 [Acidihalobacter aeolianus]
MINSIWVLVANAGRARLFCSNSRNGKLIEQAAWIDGEARLKSREIVTDKAGRARNASGQSRHAMEPKIDPKSEEAARFARMICQKLAEVMQNSPCERLHIAAAPAFLGRLREVMGNTLRCKVSTEIAKDLTTLDEMNLRRHLPDFL